MITRKHYIISRIVSDIGMSAVAINDRFIEYIQDLALDIYLSLNKNEILNDPVRYIMTYCPWYDEEKRYAAQYEGSDEEVAEATKYIDMAYHVVYGNLSSEGDMWLVYMVHR